MSKVVEGAVGAMRVTANGTESRNVTSITLPDVEIPTTEVSGAGIMGTLNLPNAGQVNAMTLSVSARSFGADFPAFFADTVELEIVFAANCRDREGKLYPAGTRFYATGWPTKSTRGKGEVGSAREESIDYALSRWRELWDGRETLLVDQGAGEFKVGGVDRMAAIRSIFG